MVKKMLLVSITVSFMLVLALSAFAGEGSDTVGGGKLLPQLRYGYGVGDWETNTTSDGPFHDWEVDGHNYYMQVNWGIFNNIDLIALVGGRSLCSKSEVGLFRVKTERIPMFLWGLGTKMTFFRADNGFYVGGGVLLTGSVSKKYSRKLYEEGVGLLDESDDIYRLTSYKITPELHVGYHFKNIGLTPYLGVDYTWAKTLVETDAGANIRLYPVRPVYMFTGIDYFFNEKFYVNVEGRTNFGEGWGIETGFGYLFDICPKPAPEPEPEPAPPIEPKLEPMSKN